MTASADWKEHVCRVGTFSETLESEPEKPEYFRKKIEPWLSSLFQSEHLSLLLGSGFSQAMAFAVKAKAASMTPTEMKGKLAAKVNSFASQSAKSMGRGEANIEDQIRSMNQLLSGLKILGDSKLIAEWETHISEVMTSFLHSILSTETAIKLACRDDSQAQILQKYLVAFLLSFASRAASRERLNLFTTNYDRVIEYGCDLAGLRVIDRFVGALCPIFRSSRIEVDMHYNPPGIRGEPRYLEGVIRFTKLHGSLDWRFEDRCLRRYCIPFGAEKDHPDIPKNPVDTVMIYPNAAKDVETIDYPYAELFRDFSSSLCRPNSVLITYGYGYGDDHINRVIGDMLTIPSTHLAIISYNDMGGRIKQFCEKVGRDAQISLLIGSHFGNLSTLVDHYLPKPAIDVITIRRAKIMEQRGEQYHEERLQAEEENGHALTH